MRDRHNIKKQTQRRNSMAKTLRISFELRNAYNVNSVIYALKQIFLIKKIIPESAYGMGNLKVLFNILALFIFICNIEDCIFMFFLIFFKTFLESEIFSVNILE